MNVQHEDDARSDWDICAPYSTSWQRFSPRESAFRAPLRRTATSYSPR